MARPVSLRMAYNLLQHCTAHKDLRQVLSLLVSNGLHSDPFLGSHVIRLFAFFGCSVEANEVFACVANPSLYTWNAVILANAKVGQGELAIQLYRVMQLTKLESNRYVYFSVLKACSMVLALSQGKIVHGKIIKTKFQFNDILGNGLLDMYVKCGNLEKAIQVFNLLPERDLISWNTIMAGYSLDGIVALTLSRQMQQENMTPDSVTFLTLLKACGSNFDIDLGKLIHAQVINCALFDVFVGNSLVNMYAKCGNLAEACKLFNTLSTVDQVSCTSMVTGYAEHGKDVSAIELFVEMQREGMRPDKVTFLSVLKACANIGNTWQGRLIHGQIIKFGLQLDIVVGSSLVDMYAKCGSLEEAWESFDRLIDADIVVWGAMLSGYVQHGKGLTAIELFQEMQLKNIKPNKVIFLSALKACSDVGAVGLGRFIHDQILHCGLICDAVIGSTLIDMYAKLGNLKEAYKVFDGLSRKHVIAWNAMIGGYAYNGNIMLAVQCFNDLQMKTMKPDDSTFTIIIGACGHAGLVDEGHFYFKAMKEDHGIMPDISHYTGIVDLLGRAGWLHEAENLLCQFQSNILGWTTLLTACRTYDNLEMARRCFREVVCLDPSSSSGYLLMVNTLTIDYPLTIERFV